MHLLPLLMTFFLTFSFCLAADLWVDAQNGDDHQDGLSSTTAIRSLQVAIALATPGTIVHIQPGIYRGSLHPLQSGTAQAPILYQAEQGRGSVKIRGSERLSWTPLTENNIGLPPTVSPQNIIWADLSSWQLTQAPYFIVQLDQQGEPIKRLLPAREPDWQVETEWKHHEFWWAAEGGSMPSTCFPPQDKSPLTCDVPSRSFIQLMDAHDDHSPIGISPGNLTTLGNLTGATLVTLDPVQGEQMFRRTIIDHDVNAGRISLDQKVQRESLTSPEGLGWGNKYYLENHPALLDQPGEYWFDIKSGRLYLWPISSDLQNIEVSRWNTGWELTKLSYITLDGLVVEFFNGPALLIKNNEQQSSYGNIFRNMQLRYAHQGLYVEQSNTPSTRGLVLENSDIAYIDNEGLYLNSRWNNDELENSGWTSPPISNTLIQNNTFHHLAFRPQHDLVTGLEFRFADHLRFENNHVHHIAFSGVNFSGSVIHSDKQRDFLPEEIKTGHLLIKDNLIEKACQLVAVCGGLRFVGTPPHRHVFRDVLLIGNTLRHHYGWSYASSQRHRWEEGEAGFGLHLKYASGIHAYRNLAYGNSSANFFVAQTWRDGDILLYNNLLAHAAYGINLWNPEELNSQAVLNTQVVNNIFVNNAKFALQQTVSPQEDRFTLDYNLYFMNGWNLAKGGLLNTYLTLDQIQTQTPWEVHGLILDPAFVYYNYTVQQQTRNNHWVDFHLTPQSFAIDRGNTLLPPSLSRLLMEFGIQESLLLPDIGPYESLGTSYRFQGLAYPAQQDTQTQFTNLVITSSGKGSKHSPLSSQEDVSLLVYVLPDSRDVGQKVDIKIVAAYTSPQALEPSYFMRHGPSWILWDKQLSTLTSAENQPSLPQQFDIPIYEGSLKEMPGDYTVYVGYMLSNGTLIFNGQNPLQFSIQ